MMHIEPTTQDTMKDAAPRSSPMARLPEPALIEENVEDRSGLPLPKARKVTPATFSSRPRCWEMVARLGVKKSDAVMPSVEKRNKSQTSSATKARDRREGRVQ